MIPGGVARLYHPQLPQPAVHGAGCTNDLGVALLDIELLLKAAIMGVVEGLTEFLPISSTGHLILAGSLLDFSNETIKVFDIAIQSGAMLAIMWEYRARLVATIGGIRHQPVARRFLRNVLVAFVPAVIVGLLFGAAVKAHLFTPLVVAAGFIVGGVLILWVERRHKACYGDRDQEGSRRAKVEEIDDISTRDALKVGLIQCLSFIPGMSRSGVSIIGAMYFGFSRRSATEFSFFLGIPTIAGATVYSLYKERELLQMSDLPMFVVGSATAFFSALVCVRWLIRYVSNNDFTVFAWYRIAFGLLVLVTAQAGWVNWTE